jgi:uncharacterized repeat protein (TIGR01451 family)
VCNGVGDCYYQLTVTNKSDTPTNGTIYLYDKLPEGLNIDDSEDILNCTLDNKYLNCKYIDSLDTGPGQTWQIDVKLTDSDLTDAINVKYNDGTRVWGGGDAYCTTKENAIETNRCYRKKPLEVVEQIDNTKPTSVTIEKTSNGSTGNTIQGDTIGYTLTITNTGTKPAENVEISDDLMALIPSGNPEFSFGGRTPADTSNICGFNRETDGNPLKNSLSCKFDLLPIDDPVTKNVAENVITITYSAIDSQVTNVLHNTAYVAAKNDLDCTNISQAKRNQACTSTAEDIVISSPRVFIEKTADQTQVQRDTNVKYTVKITNKGNIPTTAPITWTDTVPDAMWVQSAGPDSRTSENTRQDCETDGQTITCTIDEYLEVDHSVSAVIEVRANADGQFNNTAMAIGGGDPVCAEDPVYTEEQIKTSTINPADILSRCRAVASVAVGTSVIADIAGGMLPPDAGLISGIKIFGLLAIMVVTVCLILDKSPIDFIKKRLAGRQGK